MSIDQLLSEAAAWTRAGRHDEAIALLRKGVALEPENSRVLNALGNRLLSAGNGEEARSLFKKVLARDPGAAAVWLNLAVAERAAGSLEEELAALNGALTADPYFGVALLHKGQYWERQADLPRAAESYSALLACVPPAHQLAPAFQQALAHARAVVLQHKEQQVGRLRQACAGTGVRSPRFDRAIELFGGLTRPALADVPFPANPTGFYLPGLPPDGFFAEQLFPWFVELEAATPSIREELLTVIERDNGFRPYVGLASDQPANQWEQLNHSLAWSAFFLWEEGVRNDANADACPVTDALLQFLPLLQISGMAPTAMFSILKPGAVIPPHHGVTNTRAVVHLPLIVPPGCGFRVGGETREWREGVAWAFDDTVEHEAWNSSGELRAILIVDAWNPHLTADERLLTAAAMPILGGRLSD